MTLIPALKKASPAIAWAEANATTNRFGSPEYSSFVCHVMNIIDLRVRECPNACAWFAPYGFVPEAGCVAHD